MPKKPISVTLDAENITWLKGRAGASGLRSASELLNRIVTEARRAGSIGAPRSVIGTIDIDAADPLLEQADAAVRAIFDSSTGRPLVVHEQAPGYQGRGVTRKRGG